MKQLILALAITATVSACATTTSSTGRTQYVGAVSKAELDQLGAQAFTEAKQKGPMSTDARQNAYVRCVVDALARELPNGGGVRWETAVFKVDEPNAFALPGGKVGVNTGILTVAKTQDQLAAVLAHEIGHVVENHHDERITRQVYAQGGVQALGSLVGERYGGVAQQGGGILAQAGFLLPGSRVQETEADVVGQRLMAQAGFDPSAAVDLWQNMIAAGGSRPPQWLSTHPDPQSRINELRGRAGQLAPTFEEARRNGRNPRCS